jgi:hypothetical protein
MNADVTGEDSHLVILKDDLLHRCRLHICIVIEITNIPQLQIELGQRSNFGEVVVLMH